MKQKKEPIVKDERTMLLDGKIAGELVLGMTCFIALSAFMKSSILDLDLVAYLPEMFLLIAMGAYALLRIKWSMLNSHIIKIVKDLSYCGKHRNQYQ